MTKTKLKGYYRIRQIQLNWMILIYQQDHKGWYETERKGPYGAYREAVAEAAKLKGYEDLDKSEMKDVVPY